jgi:high-affinity iron transporter
MNEGTIAATFLIVFRETLEAGLIVGIILTTLVKLNQKRFIPYVLISTILAVGVSIVAGIALSALTESLQGNAEKMIEGLISLAASAILTYMVFWMSAQAKKIKSDVEIQVERVVTKGEFFAIMTLPFLAVFREGAETVLFLKAVAIQNSGAVSFYGGVSGLAAAVLTVAALFLGGRRIPVRMFFKLTGFLILLISAGLLAYGIHELEELGWIPPILYPVWNLNHILNEKQGIGSFLKALFGYNGNPSLVEVIAYWVYLVGLTVSLRSRKSNS